MGTFSVLDVVEGENGNPEQVGIIGLAGNRKGASLLTMGTFHVL
jgi:hypothetical protein